MFRKSSFQLSIFAQIINTYCTISWSRADVILQIISPLDIVIGSGLRIRTDGSKIWLLCDFLTDSKDFEKITPCNNNMIPILVGVKR